RRRGASLMRALQRELPNVLWFTFFQLSVLEDLVRLQPEARLEALTAADYGLLPAFLEGMLSAASGGMRIVDGDEWAYYAESPELFFRRYHMIRARAVDLVTPVL